MFLFSCNRVDCFVFFLSLLGLLLLVNILLVLLLLLLLLPLLFFLIAIIFYFISFILCSFQGKQRRSKHWYDYVQNFLLCLLGNEMPPNMHGRKYYNNLFIFICIIFSVFRYIFYAIYSFQIASCVLEKIKMLCDDGREKVSMLIMDGCFEI